MNLILPCQPGCCEEEECEIAADNFDRPDADDINDGAPFTWTGDNENIWITSNELLFFSGTPEKLTCGTSHPDSTSSGVVSCAMTGFTDGDELEIWLNGSDADNCTVARLTVGATGSLAIYRRIGGVDTLLNSETLSAADSTPYSMVLYYNASTEEAKVVIDGTTFVCAYDVSPIGYKAGISIGDNGGAVYANNFLYQRLGNGSNGCPTFDCIPCGCEHCDDGVAPCCLSITFSGFGPGGTGCPCGMCDRLNTTIEVPHYADCVWRGSICTAESELIICGVLATVRVNLEMSGSDYILVVELRASTFTGTYFRFEANIGSTPPPCQEWSGIELEPNLIYSGSLPSSWGQCDVSGATCLVSAVEKTVLECAEDAIACTLPDTDDGCAHCFIHPIYYLLTVPNLWTNPGCGGCAGEFLLEWNGATSCIWEYFFDGSCAWDYVRIQITTLGGNPLITVDFQEATSGNINFKLFMAGWDCSTPNRIDCLFGYEPLEIPYCNFNPFPACRWDGHTVDVTGGACDPIYTPVTIQAVP